MPNKPASPCTFCGRKAVSRGRCERHVRGGTVARGYDAQHKSLRIRLEPFVAAGRVRCARCLQFIKPGEAWDVGHDSFDRKKHTGAEHASCNRSAAAKLRNA